jgi:hypothetical protein
VDPVRFLGKQKPKRFQLCTSDEALEYRVQHKAPCADCPWARKSLKGWTGPHSVDQWLAVARDYWHPIACHTRRIAAGVKHWLKGETFGHWECAGAAIFRANTCVHRFDQRPMLELPKNQKLVFTTPMEFREHHE